MRFHAFDSQLGKYHKTIHKANKYYHNRINYFSFNSKHEHFCTSVENMKDAREGGIGQK